MLTSSETVRNIGQVAVLSGLLALGGLLCPFSLRSADLSLPITGNLVGSVVNAEGVPQMGAAIQLLNKYHQTIARVSSDAAGHFAFASLPADLYSLRASLPSFLPISRDRVSVAAGRDSVLQIHLATLVSSVEVSYIVPSSAMTDDWKWVLRSSAATRPINRYLPVDLSTQTPDLQVPNSSSPNVAARTPIFSGTHASLSLTGGDGGPLDADSSFSDFGTAFALSTEVFGKNLVQVSGSFGQDNVASLPAVGISAVYTRNDFTPLGKPPEITFTAIQIAGLGSLAAGSVASGSSSSLVALRGMSLSVYEQTDPLSSLHVEYGVTGDSVDYVQHTSRISPFARMTLDEGAAGQVLVAFSDGGRPDQLLRHSVNAQDANSDAAEDDLAGSLGSLQKLPQISNHQGALVLERTRNFELGYSKVVGSKTLALSAFSEDVNNGRLSVAGNFSPEIAPDVLSDSLSRTSVYNVGRYRRAGYIGSVDQRLSGNLAVGVAYGRMGAFQAQVPDQTFPGQLLHERNANFASATFKAVVPRIGTKIRAGYGWIDSGTVMPRHIFTTQQASAAPGFNIYVRQPVPTFLGLPGRLEITADLRNLLSQGYLPVNMSDGRQMLIVQAPQSVRGGINFIF